MAMQRTQPYRADYIWQAPDDALRYEVIDGEIYVSAAPSRKHQLVSMRLSIILGGHVFLSGAGHLYAAPFGVVLDELTGVQPDLVYLARGREHLLSERGLEGAPDLAIEIISPSTRRVDRVLKMERYARAGIPHYWIFDPFAETLEAFRLQDGAYTVETVARDDEQFNPALFPGFSLSLAVLWQ